MYQKIYKTIISMSLVILAMITVVMLTACYSFVANMQKDDADSEAVLLGTILDNADDNAAVFDNPAFSEYASRVLVLRNGEVIYGVDNKDYPYESAVTLKNGDTLIVGSERGVITELFLRIILPVCVCAALIYVLSVVFAVSLTENIIKPVKNLAVSADEEYDYIYPELQPFIKRISVQNAEIKRQIERVKRQRVRLQTVSETMSEGLIVLDRNNEIISANNSAVELFGGRELVHRNILNVTDNQELIKCLENTMNGDKSDTNVELGGRCYRVFCSPIAENSRVTGAIMLMFDISEEMKTIQIRREFSANVSHELKTPLTTILGYSQLINNGIAKEEDIKSFTGKIEHESARLITLIDDIIKLSRLDEEAETEEHIPVRLEECVAEAISLLSNRADEKNISITVEGVGDVIQGNPVQLNEMIYNLCENAIKYNVDNGKVTVKLFPKGFSVSDTGIGIPEDMKERVFERFFRVDKSRSKKVSGTGLGLSIVKHIAMCHNAQITVESEPGRGSTFTVIFS